MLTKTARAALFTTATAACSILSPDFNRVVALQVEPEDRTVAVGDTIRLEAQAVNAGGEIVSQADVFWAVIDTGEIGFTVDTTTGEVAGLQPGSGRVQARVEDIRSDPITITVVPAASVSARRGDRRRMPS